MYCTLVPGNRGGFSVHRGCSCQVGFVFNNEACTVTRTTVNSSRLSIDLHVPSEPLETGARAGTWQLRCSTYHHQHNSCRREETALLCCVRTENDLLSVLLQNRVQRAGRGRRLPRSCLSPRLCCLFLHAIARRTFHQTTRALYVRVTIDYDSGRRSCFTAQCCSPSTLLHVCVCTSSARLLEDPSAAQGESIGR